MAFQKLILFNLGLFLFTIIFCGWGYMSLPTPLSREKTELAKSTVNASTDIAYVKKTAVALIEVAAESSQGRNLFLVYVMVMMISLSCGFLANAFVIYYVMKALEKE